MRVGSAVHLGTLVTIGIQVVRWLLIVVVIAVALAVLYRVAPDRDAPGRPPARRRWQVGLRTVFLLVAVVVVVPTQPPVDDRGPCLCNFSVRIPGRRLAPRCSLHGK